MAAIPTDGRLRVSGGARSRSSATPGIADGGAFGGVEEPCPQLNRKLALPTRGSSGQVKHHFGHDVEDQEGAGSRSAILAINPWTWVSSPSPSATTTPVGCEAKKRRTAPSKVTTRSACNRAPSAKSPKS